MPEAQPVSVLPASSGVIARASRWVSLGCLWIAGAGLALMTVIISWQVFARYVLNAPPSWSEQAALYILVWTVLFAAAAGVREQFHIRITVVQDNLPTGGRLLRILAHLVTLGVGLFLAIYGADLVRRLWDFAIPTLGLPRGSAFLPMPLAGALIAFFSAEHVAAILQGREVTPTWP